MRQDAYDLYQSNGTPALVESAVLFFDLMGISAMSKGDAAGQDLVRLKRSLDAAIEWAGIEDKDATHASTWLTDNVVVGTPAFQWPGDAEGEGALLHTVLDFSYLQLMLLQDGFLGRGGLSFGAHYQDERFAFGPALIDAVVEEKATQQPRIGLTSSALEKVVEFALRFGETELAGCLAQDVADDVVFVDVFGVWIDEEDDEEVARDQLQKFKAIIESALGSVVDPRANAQWGWLADYFNYSVSHVREDLNPGPIEAAPGRALLRGFDVALEEARSALENGPKPSDGWPALRALTAIPRWLLRLR